jgi:hypothetical protein
LVAVSTCDHLLARMNKGPTPEIFEWLAYLRAAPWRGAIALVVLGADMYLGLHWLHGGSTNRRRRTSARRSPTTTTTIAPVATRKESVKNLHPLLAKRDRSAMFGHLLWQHWRQSRWLTLLMAILFVGLPFMGTELWKQITTVSRSYQVGLSGNKVLLLPIAILATLIGALVFLPDQEQRRYRFYGEHNVPPRLVWLTRQLPWTVSLLISTLILCAVWLFLLGDAKELLEWIGIVTGPRGSFREFDYYRSLTLPPIGLGIAIAAVGYAAGQLSSILVRSGILAGSLALLIAAPLCGWVLLMHSMQVSFLWSVVPIPPVLLWATWFRAPDWISENKRWSARRRLAAALLVPATAILIALPIYRVHQIPEVSPGFNIAEYEREIHENLATGLATAEIYRRASDISSPPPEGFEDRRSLLSLEEQDRKWLSDHSVALKLLLEASARPACLFGDPASESELPFFPFYKKRDLTQLMLVSARQLEIEDNLDAALDRYFATLQMVSRLATVGGNSNPVGPWGEPSAFHGVFHQLRFWGAQKGQTHERIGRAIKRLKSLDSRMLRLDEVLKTDYMLARRVAIGDPTAPWFTTGYLTEDDFRRATSSDILWIKLMPWEGDRALRLTNLLTQTAFARLTEMRAALGFRPGEEEAPRPIAGFCLPRRYAAVPGEFFQTRARHYWEQTRGHEDQWLETTVPGLESMGVRGVDLARRLAWFETDRRATIIVLALEAFRLEHGNLPKSLYELAGNYLDFLPLDPYSGRDFVYFAGGVTADLFEAEVYASDIKAYADVATRAWRDPDRSSPVELGVPGIWSTGPDVWATSTFPHSGKSTSESATQRQSAIEYGLREGTGSYEPNRPIWTYGDWFSIPENR